MTEPSSSSPPPDEALLEELMQKISCGEPDQERTGAMELRRLAKSSSINRFCIAEVGAIPLLISLLRSQDPETQTHSVTALLNLTLRNERNKEAILLSKGVDPIVEILLKGCMEAKENAAAAIFSLSSLDSFRILIGSSEVFPALVCLLRDGSPRGKKDAAAALYSLLLTRQNRARAVRAGVVPPLLQLVQDPSSGLVNESLSVILKLAAHQEGRFAIENASGLRILMDVLRVGSDDKKEYAAAVLLTLCRHDSRYSDAACELGAFELLTDLSVTGTGRVRREAIRILEYLQD